VTGQKRDASEAELLADRGKEAEKRANAQAKLACAYHVAGKLGVKESSGKQVCCTAGEGCTYRHTEQLSALTKSAAMISTHFKTTDRAMQERFKAAVNAFPSFKAADAPPNPLGTRKRGAPGAPKPAEGSGRAVHRRIATQLPPPCTISPPTDAPAAPNTLGGSAHEEGRKGTMCPTHPEATRGIDG
jgi:hypothetical protein